MCVHPSSPRARNAHVTHPLQSHTRPCHTPAPITAAFPLHTPQIPEIAPVTPLSHRPRYAPRMAQEPIVRIISIGAMSAHPLWGERGHVRTGHATTTLISHGHHKLLIDPGLPPTVLTARLAERANLSPKDITHVFLTSFHPDARRGLPLFEDAKWLISEAEREAVGTALALRLRDLIERGAPRADDDLDADLPAHPASAHAPEPSEADDPMVALSLERALLEREVATLRRFAAAPDELLPHVDLFPLHGVTPGSTGVLVEGTRGTTLVCGDAIPTIEHLERGQVLTNASDVELARDAMREAIEIADLLILGRDNLIPNTMRGPF